MTDPKLLSAEDLAEVTEIAAAMQRWEDDDLAHEQECVRCHSGMHTPAELDPSPLCDACAQTMAFRLPGIVAHAAALAELVATYEATIKQLILGTAADQEQIAKLTADRDAHADRAEDLARERTAMERERDGYRAMLCDLLASTTPVTARDEELRARARALLKNGPTS